MSHFKVASVFSNSMVLQRNKPIAVFGVGEDGRSVEAILTYKNEEGEKASVKGSTTVENEKWCLYLPEVSESEDCELLVSDGENTKQFTDIAIGEVWLCGGQSNMEFELQNCTTAKEHLENDNPNVRFYYTQKNSFLDETFYRNEAMMVWKRFDSEAAKCWSAVGYIYAKHLSEALGVTVGLIGCNWGGTSATAWMSEEAIAEDSDTNTYLEEYYKGIEGKSSEQQIKEYDDYLIREAEWNKKSGELYATRPDISWDEVQEILGTCEWPGPINCKCPYRPAGLYETMLNRVTPYSLRGWLFYQGESDDHKPAFYYKLYKRMLKQWRDDWGDETIPMLYVQLPGHRYIQDEDKKHWPVIREAQDRISKEDPYSHMACIIDCGVFNDIHPKDKEPVGERLYRLAMAHVYDRMPVSEAEAPEIDKIEFEGKLARICVKGAGNGLVVKPEVYSEIIGFEISGEDGVYYPAHAELLDTNVILVSADEVTKPDSVRYIWTNYQETVSLYGENGLPLKPFRTKVYGEDMASVEFKMRQVMTVDTK